MRERPSGERFHANTLSVGQPVVSQVAKGMTSRQAKVGNRRQKEFKGTASAQTFCGEQRLEERFRGQPTPMENEMTARIGLKTCRHLTGAATTCSNANTNSEMQLGQAADPPEE